MTDITWALLGKIWIIVTTLYVTIRILAWVVVVNETIRKTNVAYEDLSQFKHKWLSDIQERLRKLEQK
jgi:hypothetical protein